MTLKAETEAGATVEVAAFDGNFSTFHSPRAYVPGQPVTLEVALETPCRVEGRTIGSRRIAEGVFEIRIRLVSLTRDTRERMLAAMSDSRRD